MLIHGLGVQLTRVGSRGDRQPHGGRSVQQQLLARLSMTKKQRKARLYASAPLPTPCQDEIHLL